MTYQQRIFAKDSLAYARLAPLTDSICFSSDSPWETLFINEKNQSVIEPCWEVSQSAEGQKIQEVLLYGGYRLTAIVWAMRNYAQGANSDGEFQRRLHWMQTGILQELDFFMVHIGTAAARNYVHNIHIPPIMTWLSSSLALHHPADLPVDLKWAMLDEPMFRAWRLQDASWAESWWTDADFNMANIYDPQNKTRIISRDVIVECLTAFPHHSGLLPQMAEHIAVTEGNHPHTSCRSRWQQPDSNDDAATLLNSRVTNMVDMQAQLKGRRWAPKKDVQPTAGKEYLGYWDARHNDGEYSSFGGGVDKDEVRTEGAWSRWTAAVQGLRIEERGPASSHDVYLGINAPGWFPNGWSGCEQAANQETNEWSIPMPPPPADHLVRDPTAPPRHSDYTQSHLPPHGPTQTQRPPKQFPPIPDSSTPRDVVMRDAATQPHAGDLRTASGRPNAPDSVVVRDAPTGRPTVSAKKPVASSRVMLSADVPPSPDNVLTAAPPHPSRFASFAAEQTVDLGMARQGRSSPAASQQLPPSRFALLAGQEWAAPRKMNVADSPPWAPSRFSFLAGPELAAPEGTNTVEPPQPPPSRFAVLAEPELSASQKATAGAQDPPSSRVTAIAGSENLAMGDMNMAAPQRPSRFASLAVAAEAAAPVPRPSRFASLAAAAEAAPVPCQLRFATLPASAEQLPGKNLGQGSALSKRQTNMLPKFDTVAAFPLDAMESEPDEPAGKDSDDDDTDAGSDSE
ncbi:hypothetical protein BJ165DRAFT_1400700 [Panaeolus papilionaceus]|nr:hypothetical protein BJ165DRAFT_1400700 [Panaeolus papilionaceus]